jgi:DTW domain-containing protein YfiP
LSDEKSQRKSLTGKLLVRPVKKANEFRRERVAKESHLSNSLTLGDKTAYGWSNCAFCCLHELPSARRKSSLSPYPAGTEETRKARLCVEKTSHCLCPCPADWGSAGVASLTLKSMGSGAALSVTICSSILWLVRWARHPQ